MTKSSCQRVIRRHEHEQASSDDELPDVTPQTLSEESLPNCDAPKTLFGRCQWCGEMKKLEQEFLAIRNAERHQTCRTCFNRRKSSFYQTIVASRIPAAYGISAEEIGKHELIRIRKNNPRGFQNDMTLYYRFQILALCEKKYGSKEQWEALKSSRAAKRLQSSIRQLKRVPEASAVNFSEKRRKIEISVQPCQHRWSETLEEPSPSGLMRCSRECVACGHNEHWEYL